MGELNISLKAWIVRSLPISAIASVKGICFGQTFEQFWAFPQSSSPPSCISGRKRSACCIFPVGCELERRTWAITCGPTNLEFEFTCGQPSTQHRHVIQVDKLYIISCFSGLI